MSRKWSVAVLMSAVVGFTAVQAQGPEVGRLMRQKLDHSQKILEAVVTSNWASLAMHSEELERITNDQRWMVLKAPEYADHSRAYVQSIQALRQAAAARDMEKAPEAYSAMVLQCVDCHRYVARSRIAKAP